MLVRKSDGKLNFKFFIMQTIQNKVQEILTNNGLDFKIEKVPMFAHRPILALNEDAELVNDVDQVPTGYYGLYNTKSGNIINTVKDSYHVSQNDEIVELVSVTYQCPKRVLLMMGVECSSNWESMGLPTLVLTRLRGM
jgi:hypothetical protein